MLCQDLQQFYSACFYWFQQQNSLGLTEVQTAAHHWGWGCPPWLIPLGVTPGHSAANHPAEGVHQ